MFGSNVDAFVVILAAALNAQGQAPAPKAPAVTAPTPIVQDAGLPAKAAAPLPAVRQSAR